MRCKVSGEWKGLEIKGELVTCDWEGDPTIPRGINYLNDYIEDLEIIAPNDEDIMDRLDDESVDECIDILLGRV